MFAQSNRGREQWFNSDSLNQILWKDRVRKEDHARKNYDSWQCLYDEYKQLYSFCKNKTTTNASAMKAQNLRSRTTENFGRKVHPETTSKEIGWRHTHGVKLEKFGTNIRGLKNKRDIYKCFGWPQN